MGTSRRALRNAFYLQQCSDRLELILITDTNCRKGHLLVDLNGSIQNHEKELAQIIKLRAAVGLLGEKDHGNWWSSLWFTSNAVTFLSPIYGKRTDAARYQGLVETARLVHDSRIGVGRAFHLFRLPETLERRLQDAVIQNDTIGRELIIQHQQDAETLLAEIAKPVETSPGPIRIGNASALEKLAWTKVIAGHYLAAFKKSQQTFPYFAESL